MKLLVNVYKRCLASFLIALFFVATSSGLTYRPKSTSKLWDTWLYYQNGTYYLYYLVTEASPGERIDVATSQDGVHWSEVGTVLRKAGDAVWLGSGSVWKSPTYAQDKKFYMNFSEWRGQGQSIFFAESTDLVHWTRLGNELTFSPDSRYYQAPPAPSRWDCIYSIPKETGGLWGFWTATPIGHPGFGLGASVDGLHWTAMPSPIINWGTLPQINGLEIGAVEPINGIYYALLGAYTYPQFGDFAGMYIAKASSVTGPYTVDAEAYRLLTTQSRRDTYFTRFFRSPDGLLVNHQFVRRDGEAFFAPLKRAVVDSGGHLRLHYWDGNERLKGKPISIGADSSIRAAGLSNWTTDGTTIDARQSLGASVIPLEPKVDLDKGVVLEGSLTIGRPKKAFAGAGVFIEQSDGRGTGMLLQTNGVTEFGIYGKSNLGPGFVVDDTVETGISPLREYRFRLLVRRDLAELYLDDQLVQCYSLPIESYSGRLGLFVADGDAKFSNLHAWEMTLAGE